jgi:hypothetical protein
MNEPEDVVYVGIGNSDDKLSQKDWSEFIIRTESLCEQAGKVIGVWFSHPVSDWQNACFCIQNVKPSRGIWFRGALRALATDFRQDTISYAEAMTVLLEPMEMTRDHSLADPVRP